MKRINLRGVIPGVFFLLCVTLFVSAETSPHRYVIESDRALTLVSRPENMSEGVIRINIENGFKSEIFTSFRIQMSGNSFSIGGKHLEIHLRKTGFRDQITGDYILLLNDRETGVFGNWDDFYKAFSADLIYSSGIFVEYDTLPAVKVRVRVIYKKLVSPFSLLYLLPGKFIDSGRWLDVLPGELP